VDRGIAFVGCHLVVQVGLGAGPVPDRDNDVALQALRTRWLDRRQLACRNPIGPIAKYFQAPLSAEPLDGFDHVLAGLAGLDTPGPGLMGGLELTECLRDGARRLATDGVTMEAAIGFELAQELRLALHGFVDAVASVAGAGELALVRHLGQRKP